MPATIVMPETSAAFTVVSSAEELRTAARCGDIEDARAVLERYAPEGDNARFLPAVLAAADDVSGNSALHLCCANGHVDVMRLLLAAGAPPDATNGAGSTALHYAALMGRLDVVKALVEAGAEPVVESKYGKTALDEAHQGHHRATAEFLLAHVEATGETPDIDPEQAETEQADGMSPEK